MKIFDFPSDDSSDWAHGTEGDEPGIVEYGKPETPGQSWAVDQHKWQHAPKWSTMPLE